MQEQLAIAKKKDEEARESERVQELQAIRQKAHLWHSGSQYIYEYMYMKIYKYMYIYT